MSGEEFLHDVNVPFDCEFLLAERRDSDQLVDLTEVYRVAEGLPLNTNHFGVWDPRTGLTATRLYLYDRRNSLQGMQMKAAIIHLPPVTVVKRDIKNDISVEGYFGILWSILEKKTNFTSTFSIPEDDAFGTLQENGSWNGMIGMLLREQVHVAIGEFTMERNRTNVVKYLTPLMQSRIQVYLKKPDKLSLQWNSFLAPFTTRLWLGVCASILLISVTLAAMHHVCSQHNDNQVPALSSADSFFHTIALFCQQASPDTNRPQSIRSVFFFAGLTSVVLLAAYAGSLTSIFAIKEAELPFKTIQELIDDDSYKIAATRNGVTVYLANTRSNLHRQLYKKMLFSYNDDLPDTKFEAIQRLCSNDKYAVLGSSTFDKFLYRKRKCDFVTIPEYLQTDVDSMVVPKDSPYRGIFNHNLLSMRNSGVLKHAVYSQVWLEPLPKTDDAFPSVNIHQLIPILVVLGFGLVLSTILVISEMLKKTYGQGNCQNFDNKIISKGNWCSKTATGVTASLRINSLKILKSND